MNNFKDILFDYTKIKITDKQLNKLEIYYNFLIEYNKITNLTRITDRDEVYIKHFLDSILSYRLLDFNKYNSLLDMGSGAGFPGIMLKIFFPNLKIYLVDARNKKVSFLNQLIKKLDLKNIFVFHARVEELKIDKVDIITARAFGKNELIFNYSKNILKVNGHIISYKALNYKDELDNIIPNYKLLKIDTINLPNNMGERNNLLFRRTK